MQFSMTGLIWFGESMTTNSNGAACGEPVEPGKEESRRVKIVWYPSTSAICLPSPPKPWLEATNDKFLNLVGCRMESRLAFPSIASTSVPGDDSPSPSPSHWVTCACGSMSMSSVESPRTAKPDAKLIAIVLFPHPPFALITVMMFMFVNVMADPKTGSLRWRGLLRSYHRDGSIDRKSV